MRTVDHKLLAVIIEEKYMKNIPQKYKKAFYFGCIEPDYNFFSYFHGFMRSFNFYGHNFSNVKFYIEKLFGKLNKTRKPNMLFFFRLGLLIHYTTDAFTHAHTSAFSGSLMEHRSYEHKLHLAFMEFTEKNPSGFSGRNLPCNDIHSLLKLHDIYTKSEISVLNDMNFILSLTDSIMQSFNYVFMKLSSQKGKSCPIREMPTS